MSQKTHFILHLLLTEKGLGMGAAWGWGLECVARQPSGLSENQENSCPSQGGISRSMRKVLLVLLCPCSFISTGSNVMSSSVIQILPWNYFWFCPQNCRNESWLYFNWVYLKATLYVRQRSHTWYNWYAKLGSLLSCSLFPPIELKCVHQITTYSSNSYYILDNK